MSAVSAAHPPPSRASVASATPTPVPTAMAAPAIALGLVGPGRVGQALLGQLAATALTPLRLHAIANRQRTLLSQRAMPPASAREALETRGEASSPGQLADHLVSVGAAHALLVDCSGSDEVASHYPSWLAAGIHVVTPGKHAGSGPLARYCLVRDAAARGNALFRHEASVGAGLPVIGTLRNLLDTGDTLVSVEGVLSGTLAWLFHRCDGGQPFSALLREAHRLGYTEPDPRDDLSGLDVARKLVILAREAGRDLALDDVAVENLVPPALRDVPLPEFFGRLDELDAVLATRLADARAAGSRLRHLAKLDEHGRASVRVVAPEPGHASLHGRLADNVIQFRTRRYAESPLVVQGAGAGPEVTAAGVFGDILAIARSRGVRA